MQNKDMPVVFTFFNPTSDLSITGSGDGIRAFSDLLRESHASQIDRPLAYRRDSRIEVDSRRARSHASSRIDRTVRYHSDSSPQSSHSIAWDPFPRLPATGTSSSSVRVGTHPEGGMQQPRAAYTTPGAVNIGRSLTVDRPRQQGSSPHVRSHHPSGRSSRSFSEEHGRSTSTF